MHWVIQIEYLILGGMLALMLAGLGTAVVTPGMGRWNRRFFVLLYSVLSLLIVAGIFDTIFYGRPSAVLVGKAAAFTESVCIAIPQAMFTAYLLHCCGEARRGSPLQRAALALLAVYLLLLCLAQFTTFLYYISPDNLFYRGPWYALSVAPLFLLLLLNLAAVIRRRSVLPVKYRAAFSAYLLTLIAAVVIHTIWYSILIVELGVTLSALSMHVIILLDQMEQHMRQQREIASQRARIMVLQMRPHFIYNTMTSIYYLCDQDPQKAKQVTLDFTTYLHRIFAAAASEEPIPFSEELEHTRAYLAVEQARFEGSLFVDYDTPHTRFRLPPLTLQPIVENAVKHGMDPERGPLRISVRTRETPSASEITVEDDGAGFEPADIQKPQGALANMQQRLKMMCGGYMVISPRDGGGTVVRLTIPLQETASASRRTAEERTERNA